MKDFTDITFIVDRSGSMSSLSSDVIGGYEQFVKDQQKLGDNACMTLVQFDDQYEVVFNAKPIKDVSAKLDFHARGCTALLDAMGRTISSIGERLAALPESERPSNVVVVVFTDGYENASHEYSNAKIKEMVEHQQSKYNWKFLFLGANIDSFGTAQMLGISAQTTSNYKASSLGMRSAIGAVSCFTAAIRSNDAKYLSENSLESVYNATEDKLSNGTGTVTTANGTPTIHTTGLITKK